MNRARYQGYNNADGHRSQRFIRAGLIIVLVVLFWISLYPQLIGIIVPSACAPESCEPDSAFVDWYLRTGTPHFGRRIFSLEQPSGRRMWVIRSPRRLLVTLAMPHGSGVAPVETEQHIWPFRYACLNLSLEAIPKLGWSAWQGGGVPTFAPQARTTLRAGTLSMPIWVPILLFGGYPALWTWRGPIRRVRRRSFGLCRVCGYDLAGVVEMRCPECGSFFSPQKRARIVERRHRRDLAAAEWCQRYRTRRVRRWLGRMTFLLAAVFLALWPLSYQRLAVRTPYVYCRLAWGLAAVFVESAATRGEPAWSVRHFGFQGYGTIWWPDRTIHWNDLHIYLPLWLMSTVSACGAGVLYRPDLHLRARWHRIDRSRRPTVVPDGTLADERSLKPGDELIG